MIKKILGTDFKYEEDKFYRKLKTKWVCCNDKKPEKNGYIRITINKKMYYLHRLIYKYHNENWDITDSSNNNLIDHININPLDNRIENLRVVNHSQNQRNKNKQDNCSSKFIGVCWNKTSKKWQAQISINGKEKYLGRYDTEEEAHLVYEKKREELMDI